MAGPPGLGFLQEVVSAAEGISFLDTSVSATLSCHLIWRSLQRLRDQIKVSVLDRRGLACVEEGGEDHLKAQSTSAWTSHGVSQKWRCQPGYFFSKPFFA